MADHHEKVWAPVNIDTHVPEAIHVQTYEPTEEQIYAWHNHIWQEFYLVPVGDVSSHPTLTLENGLVRIKLPKGLLVLTYGEYRRGIKRGRACRRAASESKREPNQWPIGSNSK